MSVVNMLLTSGLHLFCLCKVKRLYLLPGKLGIYCFLTGSLCHSAAKRSYLLTCKSSIYFFYADVTAFFLFVTALSIHSISTLVNDVLYCNARSYIIVIYPRQYGGVQKQTAVTAYYKSMLLLLLAEM